MVKPIKTRKILTIKNYLIFVHNAYVLACKVRKSFFYKIIAYYNSVITCIYTNYTLICNYANYVNT